MWPNIPLSIYNYRFTTISCLTFFCCLIKLGYWLSFQLTVMLKSFFVMYLNHTLTITFLNHHPGQAIVSAVTNGSRWYFLGTDSAPHDKRNKECSCGCAGIYSAPVALSLYAKVFEEVIFISEHSHAYRSSLLPRKYITIYHHHN